jgi:hypothetical protein
MRRSVSVGILAGFSLLLVSCGSDDPEDAAQDVVDAAEDAAGDAEEAVEDAEAGSDLGVDEALDEAAEQAEEAGQSLGEIAEDPEGFVEDMTEDLEAQQEAVGGGGAELTVGDETWTFDSVLCAFGPEEIGDPEAEFVLSALADGLQLYVSIDGFGHSVSLNDIANFEDPAVGWEAGGFAAMEDDAGEFVEVDGKDVRAEAEFTDTRDELSPTTAPGTLDATCP